MPALEEMPEEHVYQAHGIYLLTSQHRVIRRLKRVFEPAIHGNKAWRASFLLMDYLLHHPPRMREDEQEFARLNAANLMFCEDAARRLKAMLAQRADVVDFRGRVEHHESLHAHDAVTVFAKGAPGGYAAVP